MSDLPGDASPGIIGTAGHVDHGKTALVRALTGVDTDRLPEERRRGISIELGFADLRLPSGRRAAVVDVPGHERFVKAMVAGASGMDVCLLVVAADEGVMPQTREHLQIALLLGVPRAVVALTKADLVEAEWLELVSDEVRTLLGGGAYSGAPLYPVSTLDGRGLDPLRTALDVALGAAAAHADRGFARLPVDRVFSVAGFGTVVTGTLTSGRVATEDRLLLLPSGTAVRVRGLQVHGEAVDQARAGQRVAVNLGGIERGAVRRGEVLATPGSLAPQRVLAVRFQALAGTGARRHGERLRIHLGTAEAMARLTLLQGDTLEPGGSAFALLRMESPLAASRGDRWIARSYSPVTTVGGGVVLDVGRHYRRGRASDLADLEAAERGDPAEWVRAALAGAVPLVVGEVARRAGLPEAEAVAALERLEAAGQVRAVGTAAARWWHGREAWAALADRVTAAVAAWQTHYPLRPGMPREALRHAALEGLEPRGMAAVVAALAADGALQSGPDWVALPGHHPHLPAAWATVADRLEAELAGAGLTPPPVTEVLAASGWQDGEAERVEFLAHLCAVGRLVRVDAQLYYDAEVVAVAAERVRAFLRSHGAMTVADLRDLLGVTRKHAVPLAGHLDATHVTRRVGDVRQLA